MEAAWTQVREDPGPPGFLLPLDSLASFHPSRSRGDSEGAPAMHKFSSQNSPDYELWEGEGVFEKAEG